VTIYPFKIPLPFFPHELTGYGLMMMVAFLTGGWLITLELRRRALAEDYSADIIAAAVIGGVIGAKLWYVALTRDTGTLFERGGFVWYGGFLGGAAAVILNGWRLRVPIRWTMHVAAPALAAAYALGRVGCPGERRLRRPTSHGPSSSRGLPPSTAGNLRHCSVPCRRDRAVDRARCAPDELTKPPCLAFFVLWAWPRAADRMAVRCVPSVRGVERFLIEIVRAKDDRSDPSRSRSSRRSSW
jgi:phosphatidylglycerol:prolipoprotein diacylglycerol transferase